MYVGVIITPGKLQGSIKAIASKSAAHRLLICAALADQPTDIICEELSEDIEATARSLNQLGADIIYDSGAGLFHAVPVRKCTEKCALDVGESGSTLRFLLPVVCALGIKAHILMRGRLPKRPLSPLWEELERHGCCLKRNPDGSVDTSGKLYGGEFRMAAGVSSQFISGLLFALPLLKETSRIRLSGSVESEGYIRMTIRALEQFGIRTVWDGDVLTVSDAPQKQDDTGSLYDKRSNVRKAVYISPGTVVTERDWSNGAFWEIAGMLTDGGEGSLVCMGLDETSVQGDHAVSGSCTVRACGSITGDYNLYARGEAAAEGKRPHPVHRQYAPGSWRERGGNDRRIDRSWTEASERRLCGQLPGSSYRNERCHRIDRM